MATAEQLATLTRTRVRVPMVVPPMALVFTSLADLRAEPSHDSELVDQLHHKEITRVLGERGGWLYVVAEDGYFGWVDGRVVEVMPGSHGGRRVGRALAPVHRDTDAASEVLGHLPAGTRLATEQTSRPEGPWMWVVMRLPSEPEGSDRGYISLDDAVQLVDLPHRYPTPADLIATAEPFLGTPYLWGGTSALGLDCSGLVQQVYRLNGVGLPRDADQQALAGRDVTEPRAGDLIFFGSPKVTHVALYAGDGEVIHAPQRGGFVERKRLGDLGRVPVATRRYLMDQA